MSCNASAAACALALPPFKLSWNVKSDWRTGFEYETVALSTNVISRTPQPCNKPHFTSLKMFLYSSNDYDWNISVLFTSSANIDIITSKHLATLQPSVPAPNSRHLVREMTSRSSSGSSRHFISFRFKSTADSASLNSLNCMWLNWFIKQVDCGESTRILLEGHSTTCMST